MDAMGFSAYDADGNFKGLTAVAGDLREGLSTMTVEQQNATLKTIFGSDAVRAASIIYQQGADGIQGWIDKTNDSGYAAETASLKLDNLSGDLEALGGSLETLFINGGDGTQGFLRGPVQGLTEFINLLSSVPGADHEHDRWAARNHGHPRRRACGSAQRSSTASLPLTPLWRRWALRLESPAVRCCCWARRAAGCAVGACRSQGGFV